MVLLLVPYIGMVVVVVVVVIIMMVMYVMIVTITTIMITITPHVTAGTPTAKAVLTLRSALPSSPQSFSAASSSTTSFFCMVSPSAPCA